MLFTLTDDSQLYGLEVSVNGILMIGLFCSNNRMVFFSKTGNSYYSKHVRDHAFMMSKWPNRNDKQIKGPLTFSWHLIFM